MRKLISVKPRRLLPGGTRRQRWAGLLLLAGCAVCGCGGPASPGSPATSAPVVNSPGSFAILMTSGTAAVMESTLANSVQTLIQRCMRARHFAYFPVPQSATSLDGGSVQVPELPAYGSLAQRRVHGYGLYSAAVRASRTRQKRDMSRGPAAAAARNDAYVASLPAAAQASYSTAEFGPVSDVLTVALPGGAQAQVRGGGCRAAAVRRIYGSVAGYIQAVEGAPLLTDQLITRVEADPAFAAAVRAWSRCMAARGFRYQSPNAAYNSLSGEYRARGPSAGLRHREIAVAVADFRCAQAVSLLRITAALQHEEAGRLGTRSEAQLRLITETDARAARRVRGVTDGAATRA
jgi:hypothetical protein